MIAVNRRLLFAISMHTHRRLPFSLRRLYPKGIQKRQNEGFDMSDVFISYKAEEINEAAWVKAKLEDSGLSCWMAPKSLSGGSSYAVEIPKAIRTAKIFVLILSEKCQLSKWVPRELDQAINEGKTILPFMLEDCPLKDEFSFYLSNVQRYAAFEDKTVAVEKMIRDIRATLGVKESEVQPTPAEAEQEPADTIRPEPAMPAPTTPSVAKAKKKALKPAAEKKKGKKLFWIIPASVLLLVVVLLLFSVSKSSNVTLTFKEQELTASDIANLARRSDLNSLELIDCSLSGADVSALFSAAKYRLELNGCDLTRQQLSSIDPESVTLRSLILDNNPNLTDLSMLRPLGKTITRLSFNNCSVSDAAFLAEYPDLLELGAAGNRIVSLEALSACPKLVMIDVSGNRLKDLSGIEACISLKRVFAAENQLETVDALQNATRLADADFSNNKLTDVSVLSKSSKYLESVKLAGNELTEIDALADAAALTELDVSNNKLSSLDALLRLENLVCLNASYNALTDDSGLANCRKLHDVNLSNNRIESIGALRLDESTNYATVDLSHNAITTLTLPQISYEYLALYGNPISDLTKTISGLSGIGIVFDYDESVRITSINSKSFIKYYILNCPLDKQLDIRDALESTRVVFTNEQDLLEKHAKET